MDSNLLQNETCPDHHLTLLICTYENCEVKSFCRICATEHKDIIKHYSEHFDYIKPNDLLETKGITLVVNECYDVYNNCFSQGARDTELLIDTQFITLKDNITQFLKLFKEKANQSIRDIYQLQLNEFEAKVKQLTETLSNPAKKINKDEFKKIKGEFDEMNDKISNPDSINKLFTNYNQSFDNFIKNLKLEECICDTEGSLRIDTFLNKTSSNVEENQKAFITGEERCIFGVGVGSISQYSSFQGSYNPENIRTPSDGSLIWMANTAIYDGTEFLEIKFDKPYLITRMIIQCFNGYPNFKMTYMNQNEANSTWIDLIPQSDANSGEYPIILEDKQIICERIRLVTWVWDKLQVFGKSN